MQQGLFACAQGPCRACSLSLAPSSDHNSPSRPFLCAERTDSVCPTVFLFQCSAARESYKLLQHVAAGLAHRNKLAGEAHQAPLEYAEGWQRARHQRCRGQNVPAGRGIGQLATTHANEGNTQGESTSRLKM